MEKQKYRLLNVVTVVFVIIYGIMTLVIINNGAEGSYNALIGQMGLIALLWSAVSMKMSSGTYFSLNFLFEVGLYVITLGQSFFTALHINVHATLNLYDRFVAADVNKAYLFSILCFLITHLGILVSVNGSSKKFTLSGSNDKADNKVPIDYTDNMRKIGWILFFPTIISYGIQAVKLIAVYRTSGYADAYESISGRTSWNKLFSSAGNFFPFVLFMLLASYKDKPNMQRIIKIMILIISLFNFSLGNRSEPVCYLLALLWFSKKTAKTSLKKKSRTLSMILVVFLIALIIPVIGNTRNTGELSVQTVINSLSGENSLWNAFVESIMGMGWVAFPTIKTMQLIPSQFGYHYGQSYFFALLSVFPNLFGGVHISVKYAGLAGWLKKTLKMGFGPGYSMPAEAYYNFGWFGFLFLFVIGYFIGKILNEKEKQPSTLRLFVMMSGFVVLFTISRRDMLTAVRNMAYYVGFLCLIVKMSGKVKKVES